MNSSTTKIYLYHQRHRVVLLDTSGAYFSRRYRQVYTKNLIAHRGTDNQILIEFVNQDQKRIPITGKEFTCRLISHDGTTLLLEKPLVSVNDLTGQTKLVLTEQELDLIAPGKVSFSVEQTADNALYEPVYVDDNSGARGVIDVVDSIMPSFIDSEVLTIPDGQTSPYVSSVLNTDDTDLHTFQFVMDQFTGTIETYGATDPTGPWYLIATENIVESDLHDTNVVGYHPYIRFTFTDGTVVTAGTFVIDHEYTIEVTGTTDFVAIGAADDLPNTVFTATGVGVGDGTAIPTDPDFPGTITEIRHR